MNHSTMKKAIIPPVLLRPSRRTWLNYKGELATPQTTNSTPQPVEVLWDGKVIDAVIREEINTYPSLNGRDTVSSSEHEQEEIKQVYLNRCRFLDNPPDLDLLQKNVNAGIWEIELNIHHANLH